jgi:WD40 repeat protein
MRFLAKRTILLISLIGIVFAFTKSEQFGRSRIKIVSLDFSPDGKKLAVARNHAVEHFDADYQTYLADFSRSIHVLDLASGVSSELLREPIPVDRVGDEEWLRILGQRPDYEHPLLPFSPVQFLKTGKLAVFDFGTQSVEAFDVDSATRELLVKLQTVPGEKTLTPGWFRVLPDEQSVLVEDSQLDLFRYRIESGALGEPMPLGEPFYMNTQNLSLGPFIDLRILGRLFQTPRPIFGSSCHPQRSELAVATVSQICIVKFDGRIPKRLIAYMKIGSTVQYFPNGKRIVALFHDLMRFYDLEAKKLIAVVTNDEKFMTAFAISPDSTKFATGDNHGVVRIWDADTLKLASVIKLDGTWQLDWRVPYVLGFAWGLIAIITYGFEPFKRKRPQLGLPESELIETPASLGN